MRCPAPREKLCALCVLVFFTDACGGLTRAPLSLPRLLVDTFAAGLVAFLLAIQWRWYISARRDVKMLKKHLLLGVLDRAVLREVDIAEFALLGRDKKPEAPKVSGPARVTPAALGLTAGSARPHATRAHSVPFPRLLLHSSLRPLPGGSTPRLCWTTRSGG